MEKVLVEFGRRFEQFQGLDAGRNKFMEESLVESRDVLFLTMSRKSYLN